MCKVLSCYDSTLRPYLLGPSNPGCLPLRVSYALEVELSAGDLIATGFAVELRG